MRVVRDSFTWEGFDREGRERLSSGRSNHLFYQPKPIMSRLIPILLVVATSAFAQQLKAKIVVLPFASGEGASETASAKFNALIVDELKQHGDVLELVAPPSTKPAPPPEKPGVVKRGPSP